MPLTPEYTVLPTGDVGYFYYHGVYYHNPEGAVIGRGGALWIGKSLVDRIGGRNQRLVPFAVPDKKMIAFRRTEPRQWGLKLSVGQNSGGHISATGIIKSMGLVLPDEPVALSAYVEDNWLIVDVSALASALAKFTEEQTPTSGGDHQ